eukprot:4748_1
MLSEAVSIVLPALWPFYQGLYLLVAPEDAFRKPMKLQEYTFEWSPKFLIAFNAGIFLYALVSWLSFEFTFPDLDQPINWVYWIPVIVIRELVITVIIYEPWHYLTHSNKKFVKKLAAKKFNSEMPDNEQWTRDRFWSLSGTVIAAIHELIMIYLWKYGYAEYYMSFWSRPVYSVFWSFFMVWWRHFHFFFVHRMIHPWFGSKSAFKSVDIGRILYDKVHSLHHKSYNPGPWSGLSMHPVEHIFYYSCVWFPALFIPQHPICFMINKFHATISPAPGHDGYDSPIGGGSGGYFHYLHHAHYECNYGTDMVPLDKLFGCFEDGSKFRKKKKN